LQCTGHLMTQPATAFASGTPVPAPAPGFSAARGGSPLVAGAGLFTSTLRIGIVRPPHEVYRSVSASSLPQPASSSLFLPPSLLFAHARHPGEKHRARATRKTQQRAPLGGRTFFAPPPSHAHWLYFRQARAACAEIVLFGCRGPFPAKRSSSMLQVRARCLRLLSSFLVTHSLLSSPLPPRRAPGCCEESCGLEIAGSIPPRMLRTGGLGSNGGLWTAGLLCGFSVLGCDRPPSMARRRSKAPPTTAATTPRQV
jgi:hypothetical protein